MAVKVALYGATGRMGTRIAALAEGDDAVRIVRRMGRSGVVGGGVEHRSSDASGSKAAVGSDVGVVAGVDVVADVIIDFSSESGTRQAIADARAGGAALLVGTTGLSAEILQELALLARSNAVLIAPNTSLGVAVTRKLARLAAELLGPAGPGGGAWSVDIVESHHDRKKDAPSGTAIAIARALESGGMAISADRIHAIRAGDTIGEHEIRFAGPSERIHVMHQAVTRDLFAAGALRAATWLAGRSAGSYTMDDVLG
ncbi:MAG: 4-hydroxy-tetrahydrodipicolinate reductase [Phycisphaerales bacterium]